MSKQIHIHIHSGKTRDSYHGSWNEEVEPEEARRFKVGSIVNRKGVKVKVAAITKRPARKTENGTMAPEKIIVTFDTVE